MTPERKQQLREILDKAETTGKVLDSWLSWAREKALAGQTTMQLSEFIDVLLKHAEQQKAHVDALRAEIEKETGKEQTQHGIWTWH